MRCFPVFLMMVGGLVPALPAQQTAGPIEPPAGTRVVLKARAEGVQIYACTSAGSDIKWVLQGPEAKLLDTGGKQIGTHFAGPTWRLNDGSQVQGELIMSQPSPDAGAVAWLLLRAKAGTATGTMAQVAFIRRAETQGGVAAAPDCQSAGDTGRTVRVPYTATYTFYASK